MKNWKTKETPSAADATIHNATLPKNKLSKFTNINCVIIVKPFVH